MNSDITFNRHRNNEQSNAAYQSIAPDSARLREMISDFIKLQGKDGATCYEVSEQMGLGYTTVSARMSELKRDGLIKHNGDTRPTLSGRAAAVMVIAEEPKKEVPPSSLFEDAAPSSYGRI